MKKQKLQSMIPVHTPNLEEIFDTHRDADKARVILQHLFHVRQMMKDNENYAGGLDRKDRWCPLLASNLKKLVRDYHRIIKVLTDNRIIEFRANEDGGKSYFPGLYSMVYRPVFPEHLLVKDFTRYRMEHITTPGVINAVRRYYNLRYEKQRARLLRSTPWYRSCLEFMDRLQLDVTRDEVLQLDVKNPEITAWKTEQFNSGMSRFVTRDDYGGRIHSYVANLPKKLRPFLRLDSQNDPLVLIDVKCSQLYMLGALFYYKGLVELIPEFRPIASKLSQLSTSPNIRLFFDDCRRGTFYDDLIKITGLEKKPLKELLFGHVLYSAPFGHKDNEITARTRRDARHLFGSKYKDVLHNLDTLKKTKKSTLPFVYDATKIIGKNGRTYGKMYSTPNMMATRLETSILLERITRNCVNIGIETCTIHDAWILKEKDLGAFKDVFYDVFKTLGIQSPELDVEHLNRA